MTIRTEAVPAEMDPNAEPAPSATGSEGGLPTVSETGGAWNDALVVQLVSACAAAGLGDEGAIRKARAGIAAMTGIAPGDVLEDMAAAQLVAAHTAAMDCYRRGDPAPAGGRRADPHNVRSRAAIGGVGR